MMKEKSYLTVQEAAEFLGLSYKTLNKWRLLGMDGPPYHRFGTAIRYRRDDLTEWARRHRVQPGPRRQARE